MKKWSLLFTISLLLGIIITSQWSEQPRLDTIIPQTDSGVEVIVTKEANSPEKDSDSHILKWGYMDHKGQLVIPPQFDLAQPFSDGVAEVSIVEENKHGFINREGEWVIPIADLDQYVDNIWKFSEGLLPLREKPGGKIGYIDTTGKFAIEPRFKRAYSFQEGVGVVDWLDSEGKLHNGYVDHSGKIVLDLEDWANGSFHQGVAAVNFNGRDGLIDRQGNLLIEPILSEVNNPDEDYGPANVEFKSGKIRVKVGEPKESSPYKVKPEWVGKWGYVDQKGGWAIEPQFFKASQFSEGRAIVVKDKKDFLYESIYRGTLIDEEGNAIEITEKDPTPLLNWASTEFHGGLADVRTKEEDYGWGYIDPQGKWAIEPKFSSTLAFSGELARVDVKRKIGYINKTGQFEIPPQFDYAFDFQDNGLAIVRVGGKRGLIDRSGQYVIEPKYHHLSEFVNGLAKINEILEYRPYYYLNSDLKILPCPYWGGEEDSADGLIPVALEIPLSEECQLASSSTH